MQRLRLYCEGIKPLLLDPASEEFLDKLSTRVRQQPRTDINVEEEAKSKVLISQGGNLYFPLGYLFSCLIEAGRFVKYDAKMSLSTSDSTRLTMVLTLQGDKVVLGLRESNGKFKPLLKEEWTVDKRRGVNRTTKAPVRIIRPKIARWGFEVEVVFDNDRLDLSKLLELFRVAGLGVGVGSFRPDKKGEFGMFELKEVKVLEEWKPEQTVKVINLTETQPKSKRGGSKTK